jgi:acyl-CoA thioesterase
MAVPKAKDTTISTQTSTQHPFDLALRLDHVDDRTRRGRTHPAWSSMIGPFGGITAATLLRAVETHPDRLGDPLAVTVNYAAPITEGEFAISLRIVRTNRTNQHWLLELSQDGDVRTTATALFGLHRDSWNDAEAIAPVVPVPEKIIADTEQAKFAGWSGLYDLRFVKGRFPGEGSPPGTSAATTLWLRDAALRHTDYPALAALSDVFCPRIFMRRGSRVPAGTISVTTYFLAAPLELAAVGSDYLLATARANRFSGGYHDQDVRVWTRQGALLATSHQIVYFKG